MIDDLLENAYDQLFRVIQSEFKDDLFKARVEYNQKAGVVPEEYKEEYENKMICFNEWFLYDYKRSWDDPKRMIHRVASEVELEDDLKKGLGETKNTILELVKAKKNKIVVKDWILNKKFVLAKGHPELNVIVGDLFIGRLMTYNGELYLTKGMSLLPSDTKPIIKKKIKEINKNKVDLTHEEFLLQLEAKKCQSLHYKHLPLNKIFQF